MSLLLDSVLLKTSLRALDVGSKQIARRRGAVQLGQAHLTHYPTSRDGVRQMFLEQTLKVMRFV